jgi:hypothetical protein
MKTTMLRQKRWWGIGVAGGFIILLVVFLGRGKTTGNGTTFTARRGPLDINVLEGGNVQALESQEIKCEVRVGYQGLKILKIVEEGYQVTEDDVRTNKALVELDSSEIQNRITQQDITFESTVASFVDAQQAYDIQLIQNFGDVKAAEQKVRFARLDLDKLLGDASAQEIIETLGLAMEETASAANALDVSLTQLKRGTDFQTLLAPGTQRSPAPATESRPPAGKDSPTNSQQLPNVPEVQTKLPPPSAVLESLAKVIRATNETVNVPRRKINMDFSKYANIDRLGDGEVKQKLRKFEDDLQLARKELGKAQSDLEGMQRLFARQFVTKTELQTSELAFENNRLRVQTAVTAQDLYKKYEFLKACEEAVSKYEDALRELDRTKKSAFSKLAQAEARLKSAQGRYNLEDRQRKELYEQLVKCNITAKKQGLVVYGGSSDDSYYGGEERIREGATVRERQSIITIPDMTKMGVRVKIHETYIKKIKKGQKVHITVDAYPDKILDGEVTKVGLLPDSGNRWMNPDLKVYLTTIAVEGVHEWLKPGMSAKVEILVDHLDNVVYVPIQAVFPEESKQVCYLDRGAGRERRIVEIGESNDDFIEVKNGIKEGDRVCLRAPQTTPRPTDENGKESNQPGDRSKPASPAAPANPSPIAQPAPVSPSA